LWGIRWRVAYPISYRQLEEMMEERGVEVDRSTLNRWVLKHVPLLDQQFRARKRPVGSSWRLEETYVRLKGAWKYLYRAVDKTGARVDFLLTANGIAKPRCASRPRRSVIMTLLRKPRSTRAAPTRRRSQATMRNMRRALKSVRSNISTISSSRTPERSSDWCGQCSGRNRSSQQL